MDMNDEKIIDVAKLKFMELLTETDYMSEKVEIHCKALSKEEAIGDPLHRDYPIQLGKEKIIEANFKGTRGHAFSDAYFNYCGTVKDIIDMTLDTNAKRAIFIASLNAVLSHMGKIKQAVHCRDNELLECRDCFKKYISDNFGKENRFLLVGLQPRFLSVLADLKQVHACDMNPDNIGSMKDGIIIDSPDRFIENAKWSEVIFSTGSTVVNGTIDKILKGSSNIYFYGVTLSGVAHLMKLKNYCHIMG